MKSKRAAFAAAALMLMLWPAPTGQAARDKGSGPSRLDLDTADIYLTQFEKSVDHAQGKPVPVGSGARKALQLIKKMRQAHPDHPKVKELFERAKKVLRRSRGAMIDITPEMLAFRDREKQMRQAMAALTAKAWKDLQARIATTNAIAKPFPAPDPENVSDREVTGRYVILEGFEYPQNEFTNNGVSYVFVGAPARGFYYVHAGTRGFLETYEAVKRFRRTVTQDLPTPWTVVGKIGAPRLMVPEPGDRPIGNAHWGWVVEPTALYVPNRVLAIRDENAKAPCRFVGEDQSEQLLAEGFTIKAVPKDVKPGQLVDIWVTAIKEKNYDLYLDCIDPDDRKTRKQLALLRYCWDISQESFAKRYVHVEIFEVGKVTAIQGGGVEEGSLEDYFTEEKDKRELDKHKLPLIEEVRVRVRLYDEHGRNVGGLPKPCHLRRKEKGRWYLQHEGPF